MHLVSSRTVPPGPTRKTAQRAIPGSRFRTAEDAWFWTMASLRARQDGTGSGAQRTPRPCTPDDVLRSLDRLYRQRRIDALHARVLRVWGERQTAPDSRYEGERCDHRIWKEAMNRLDWPLRVKGIVG